MKKYKQVILVMMAWLVFSLNDYLVFAEDTNTKPIPEIIKIEGIIIEGKMKVNGITKDYYYFATKNSQYEQLGYTDKPDIIKIKIKDYVGKKVIITGTRGILSDDASSTGDKFTLFDEISKVEIIDKKTEEKK